LNPAAPQQDAGGAGRETVDHPSGRYDDRANVVAGAVVTAHRAGRVEPVRLW